MSPQAQRELTATARGLTSEMERIEPGTADWARAASLAFSFHVSTPVSERPFWWTDESLLALSARIVRIIPEDASTWAMRGQILAARTFLGSKPRFGPFLAPRLQYFGDQSDIQLPHAPIVRDVGFLIRKVGRRQPAVA